MQFTTRFGKFEFKLDIESHRKEFIIFHKFCNLKNDRIIHELKKKQIYNIIELIINNFNFNFNDFPYKFIT